MEKLAKIGKYQTFFGRLQESLKRVASLRNEKSLKNLAKIENFGLQCNTQNNLLNSRQFFN